MNKKDKNKLIEEYVKEYEETLKRGKKSFDNDFNSLGVKVSKTFIKNFKKRKK